LEGVRRLMDATTFSGPVNIGSDEMVTISHLAEMIIGIANKNLTFKPIQGPLGVRGRNSDNQLIKAKLGWAPSLPLKEGLRKTYLWIAEQVAKIQ
jgi:GDP-D-mannose 3', 5'-epimerase